MIGLSLTVQQAQAMPQPVLDWLTPHMNPTDTEWINYVRVRGGTVSMPPPEPPPATVSPAVPRVVEKTPEGLRVTIPPSTTAGVDQQNSPFWAQGANTALMASAAIAAVPEVPSAVPPVVSLTPPSSPTGLNAPMFSPMPVQPQQAAAASAPVPLRNPEHMRSVTIPQIMAARGVGDCQRILADAGINHISHITEANVDKVAEAIHRITGVVV